jgi:hypothetical protein
MTVPLLLTGTSLAARVHSVGDTATLDRY